MRELAASCHSHQVIMQTRNIPIRSGRTRRHSISPKPQARQLLEIRTRQGASPKSRKLIARAAAAQPVERPRTKRRRGEPAPVGGFEGKRAAHWSAYRENRTNAKRKPEARRTPAAKKALRRGALNRLLPRFAPQSAINRARRNKAGMAPGATRPSKSAVRD